MISWGCIDVHMEISDQELAALGKLLSDLPGLMAVLREFSRNGERWIWTGKSTPRSRLFSEILIRRRSLGCWDPVLAVETEPVPVIPWHWDRGGRRM